MAILNIDGIGKVEVGNDFTSLPPDRQAAEVDAIAAQIKPRAAAPPEPVPTPSGRPMVAQASAAPAALPSAGGVKEAVGRVASRAGEVASDRFGDKPFGLSEQTLKELRDKGALAQEGTAATPIQLLNEVVYNYGSKAGDLALRAIAAGIGAFQGGVGQTALELGTDQGMAKRLERDVGMLADTVGIVSGSGPAIPKTPRAPAGAPAAATTAGETLGPQSVKIAAPGGAAEFRAAASPFYKAAEEAGVVLKPESYGALATDIFQTAAKNRLDPTLTPGSTAAVKRISELTDARVGPISFETLDTMRGVASDARQAAKTGSNDARVAGLIVDKIDDFVAQMGSKDVLFGDAKAAADTIVKARDLWSRAAKLDKIETLIDRAQTSAGGFAGSGFENAIRTEFRTLAKSKERMKAFSADEQKAIKLVARGGTGGNAARNVGRLAPTGVVSGALGGGIGAAVGTAIGVGPMVGAIAAGSVGFAGRKLATVLTQRSVNRLQDMIRTKGESPMAASSLKRGENLLAALQEGSIAAAAAPEGER